MKNVLVSRFFIGLILIATCSFFITIDLSGQTARDAGTKQYVQVNLKNGEAMVFEYRSFIEMNLALQADKTPDASIMAQSKTFGENRVLFKEKDSCVEQSISLDNLQEMEFIGVVENKCTQKKDRLFRVYLLDLDKYEGFFQPVETNLDKPLDQQGLQGQVLNTADTKTLRFEDIEKITFFAR